MRCRAKRRADGQHNREGDVSAKSNAEDCVSQERRASGNPIGRMRLHAASGFKQGDAGNGEHRGKADVVRDKRLREVLVTALAVLLT